MMKYSRKKPRADVVKKEKESGEYAFSNPMKRLTIDLSADLHTAIKVSCAKRGVKMADDIRELLKQKYRKG